MHLKERKPVVGKTTGFLKSDVLAGKIDTQEDSSSTLHLQASRIRERFPVSWAIARVTAEIHFGSVTT